MNTLKLSDFEVATLVAALGIAKDYWGDQIADAKLPGADAAMRASVAMFEDQKQHIARLREKVEEVTGQ